ncbi:succinylglutamate desuccinylase/aspartoacylase family protein [Chelativorans sp. SCAU2101]|jgi:Predicted deacylase|uniref:Succinylglutamate desuccinylase/aspartoacylase family protein n=1 Tax=Chelativorans petroleitrophicus TaxID=2975484 RepID=A0A9X2X857_9HYPH|nr:succinylglutamate desuccinylase/aspartoacylase family protein [Chelativorans petroleitrophicus]MCT8990468.1 succinylglutamate desuccinylase/aspartoacylase family protein [Chelativorans petroleitrophicus]
MARSSTAFTDLDFDRPGKQTGYINIPHSPHEDAWGATRIPLCVIKNGEGPTAILMGGNHGDEYEGPITLGEIIRDLDPASISGRLIILPALNLPAVMAGRRTSPVDGLNLNRTFPGNPAGSITEQITAYLSDYIYPLGDALLDLHSGGSSLNILPSAIVEPAPTPEHQRRNIEAVLAFDAPLTVVIDNLGEPRTSTAASVRAGLTTVGTEMAGAGTVSREALDICRRGVRNVLSHLGILPASSASERRHGDRPILKIPGPNGYVFATADGVFEAEHELGTTVKAGDVAGRIHFLHQPWRQPETLYYNADGMVYGRRQPGRVTLGNCCVVVAAPYEGEF